MEIKLKLSEVLNINQSLKSIIDDTNSKIDSLFKFKLLGIMKAIEAPVVNFNTIRNEKINEYGEQTEDGIVSISKDNEESIKKFSDDILNILDTEISITITKLKAGDIFDKGVKAEYLLALYPIIEN